MHDRSPNGAILVVLTFSALVSGGAVSRSEQDSGVVVVRAYAAPGTIPCESIGVIAAPGVVLTGELGPDAIEHIDVTSLDDGKPTPASRWNYDPDYGLWLIQFGGAPDEIPIQFMGGSLSYADDVTTLVAIPTAESTSSISGTVQSCYPIPGLGNLLEFESSSLLEGCAAIVLDRSGEPLAVAQPLAVEGKTVWIGWMIRTLNPTGWVNTVAGGPERPISGTQREDGSYDWLPGVAAMMRGDDETARRLLGRLALSHPERAAAWCFLAYLDGICDGRLESDAWSHAASLRPDLDMSASFQAYVHFEGECWEEAEIAAWRALSEGVRSSYPISILGRLSAKQGQLDEGIEACQLAIELDPDSRYARRALASLYADSQNWPALESVCQQWMDDLSDDYGGRMFLAWTYEQLDQPHRAIDLLAGECEKKAQNAYRLRTLGDLYLGLGRLGEAFDSFEEASRLEPESAEAWWGLSGVTFDYGRYQESLDYAEKACALEPSDTFVYYNLGVIHESLGSQAEAIQAYEAAIQADPNDADAYWRLAGIRVDEYRLMEAVACLEHVVRIRPDVTETHAYLAIIHAEQNDRTAMRRELRALQEKSPDLAAQTQREIDRRSPPPPPI